MSRLRLLLEAIVDVLVLGFGQSRGTPLRFRSLKFRKHFRTR